jgi:Asp-tRNA(Asn)/Glu-tRNA(Gln) amidotransferase A subunit family amidase
MTGRRQWIAQCFLASGAVATLSQANLLASSLETTTQEDGSASKAITAEMVRAASWLSRVPLDDAQCEQIAKGLNAKAKSIEALRSTPIDENTAMAMTFMPWYFVEGAGNLSSHEAESVSSDPSKEQGNWRTQDIQLPSYQAPEDAAFWSVRQLAVGLRRKLFSSVQLTQMYLDRLKKYDPVLHCVVNYHGRALDEARIADEELSQGKDRGILHGIPWGAKDIISIPGMPTTWGAIDYKDTVRESLATVAKRMKEAGAILLAKLSVGTLAWGDKWFAETTRNPWDTSKGSSGSSAGSASATVAGLCGFAIGSETLGSIVSPTRVCCTSGLRPTFGRVSRFGCMTLGWSMDKIGPIARHIEDCGWIFEAMIGVDGLDASVVDRPFSWPVEKLDLTKLRVGVPKNLRRSEGLISELFRAAGATMVEIDFPADPRINAMSDAISVEAATMHGDLFEKIEKDSQVGEWGPSFREAQFCSAIDYVQAMRARVDLVQKTETVLRGVDVLIGDGNLTRMNLTGHPSLVVSFGTNEEQSRPNTVVLTSKFFAESELLQSGIWIQEQLPPLPSEPPISTPEAEKTE